MLEFLKPLEPICREYCSEEMYNWFGARLWPEFLTKIQPVCAEYGNAALKQACELLVTLDPTTKAIVAATGVVGTSAAAATLLYRRAKTKPSVNPNVLPANEIAVPVAPATENLLEESDGEIEENHGNQEEFYLEESIIKIPLNTLCQAYCQGEDKKSIRLKYANAIPQVKAEALQQIQDGLGWFVIDANKKFAEIKIVSQISNQTGEINSRYATGSRTVTENGQKRLVEFSVDTIVNCLRALNLDGEAEKFGITQINGGKLKAK